MGFGHRRVRGGQYLVPGTTREHSVSVATEVLKVTRDMRSSAVHQHGNVVSQQHTLSSLMSPGFISEGVNDDHTDCHEAHVQITFGCWAYGMFTFILLRSIIQVSWLPVLRTPINACSAHGRHGGIFRNTLMPCVFASQCRL